MSQNVALLTREDAANVALLNRALEEEAPQITSMGMFSPHLRLGVNFSQTVQVSGTPPILIGIEGLPPGLTYDPMTRVISGAPTQPGLYEVTITAENDAGEDEAVEPFVVVLNEGAGGDAPTVTSVAAAPTDVNIAGSETAELTIEVLDHNDAPVANLPGVAISDDTSIATVTQPAPTGTNGRTTVTVASGGTSGETNIKVVFDGVESNPVAAIVQALAAPQITQASPPTGTAGIAYSYQFAASGVPTPTWSVVSGSLPPGLTLSAAGLLSGTPTGTATQSYTFTVRALNSEGQATQSVTVSVSVMMVPPTITTVALGALTLGELFFEQLTATGGVPMTWTLQAGSALPPGLSLSSSGVISGTPTVAGPFTFTVVAANAAGSNSKTLSVTVGLPLGNRIVIDGVDPKALEMVDVCGLVCHAPTNGNIAGARIGEFSGKRFIETSEGAGLTILTSEFGGAELQVGTPLRVYLQNMVEDEDIFSTSFFDVEVVSG